METKVAAFFILFLFFYQSLRQNTSKVLIKAGSLRAPYKQMEKEKKEKNFASNILMTSYRQMANTTPMTSYL